MPIDIVHGLGYRVGESNRPLGIATPNPDGFIVLNQQNNKLFIASGGIWTDGGTYPNTSFTTAMFDQWLLS